MIVVTGGAGFIGSNIVASLNEAGHNDIVIVDVLGSGAKWRNIAKRRFADIVAPDHVESFLSKAPLVQAVFHIGANSSTTATDADEILESNFRASVTWWKWCAANGVPLLYASSAATYGDGSVGFTDDDDLAALERLRPLNLYGWSKHAFDKWAVLSAMRGFGPPKWAGLKFFNVYGANEYHKGDMQSLVAKLFGKIAAGETISLFRSYKDGVADGEQLRDFIYVQDCVRAMMWFFNEGRSNGLFNLGTGQARSFRDLVMATGAALGTCVKIQYVEMPESIGQNYQYFTQADMRKLRRAGYREEFRSLEDGVSNYVSTFLTQSDRYA